MQDIDWNDKWRLDRGSSCWKPRPPASWNTRARAFARRGSRSLYAGRFLELMCPRPEWSVLDVGCGPGTLALPLAKQVRRVTALDFSEGMLELLHQEAERRGLGNITTALASWTDDWEAGGIPPHDVAIASRSLAVEDLGAALQKLERHARTAVFLSDRVGPGPFDPAAYAAVGRQLKAGPDYIYTVNLLHQMGRLPRVDYIELDEAQCFDSLDDAMEGYRWMFKDLSAQEEARLLSYLEQRAIPGPDGGLLLHRDPPPHWAFIWWPTRDSGQR